VIAIRRLRSRPLSPAGYLRLLAVFAGSVLLLASCSDTAADDESPLSDLQVVGVDFQLNSVLLLNNGAEEVRTEDLHLCQGEMCFEFNIFSIAPRTTIVFSVSRAGEVVPAGGEIALYESEVYSDPDSMLDYVAWGSAGQPAGATAAEALLWSEEDFVETGPDTIILTRIDPATGSEAWSASDEIP
jgi:hypothetical protein